MFANVPAVLTPLRARLLLVLAVLLAVLTPTAPGALAAGKPETAANRPGAEVVAVTRVADRQVDLSVRSTALGGRTVEVRLLTPDGWVHKRNPRTLAGVDGAGRTVLVTADGRSTDSLGLSIGESAAVARSLGLRDAVNLDGGGSTTMVAEGAVLNSPSDAAGERPVGDALLILPHRHDT
ncbi:phosphodiester glycosidase family protein [Streptomyces sp. enrichment culture]|uniref:phosphodiester glycosidase family protein n=1 Tax=Streptomyces sp. enrichment culture TaxID=1795815 RepID=UPI003F54B722